MAPEIVDARGRWCPEPVLLTRRALDSLTGDQLTVLVDAVAARENVSRMARNAGWSVMVEEIDGGYCLTLTRPS
ncbi:MAG: sulfurtransferase TusA family protein [Bacillota bacterium]